MLYWNPTVAESEFVFNDRDPLTNRLFTVLCDISQIDLKPMGMRKREYRFDDVSIANSGVCPVGRHFAAINYGRLARLRPVTGYPEASDWTREQKHPDDDGVFVIDMEPKRNSNFDDGPC
ncbi:MAG: hypothetical protein FJ267_13030 [Planctomycetes bacterium]|nr:hypothetical protein [Planctomycetota bacterium]